MITALSFKTTSNCELIDITKLLAEKAKGIKEGTLIAISQHTTCPLWINEAEMGLIHDLKHKLAEFASSNTYYEHDDFTKRNCPKDEPKNAHAHLQSLLFSATCTIPIQDGKLMLGTYQSVFLVELDGPRAERKVIVQTMGQHSQNVVSEERVVLVNKKDKALGTMPKLEAHKKGALHRAFSIFIRDNTGRWLLQQRALSKYHCAGLWTNACCSHPRPNEDINDAVHRRLKEELSIDIPLKKLFKFYYHSHFDNGLQEHELDHVFIGIFNETPKMNPEEAEAYAWKTTDEINEDLALHPERYTPWFKLLFAKVASHD